MNREEIYNNLIVSGLWALIASQIGYSLSFFKLPPLKNKPSVSLYNLLEIFLVFILIPIIIIPALGYFIYYSFDYQMFKNHTPVGWANLLNIFITAIASLLILFSLPKQTRDAMFGKKQNILYNLSLGAYAWFIGYPLVNIVSNGLTLGLSFFTDQPLAEQSAIKHLQALESQYVLYFLMVFSVIFIVPILEEVIFRGFLQSWLTSKLKNRIWSIILASLCFAAFHYTYSQGLSNIVLLSSLFLLSCLLGFLYERQGSLWGPIGLHASFNCISILMLNFVAN